MPERSRFAREIRGSDILITVGVAVLYVLAAKLGLALAFQARPSSSRRNRSASFPRRGLDDHLLKPVSPHRLLDLVKLPNHREGKKTVTGRDGR